MKSLIPLNMSYVSLSFFVLTVLSVLIYYIVPKQYRWIVLLIASSVFYYSAAGGNIPVILLFISTILVSYISGMYLGKQRNNNKKGNASSGSGKWTVVILALICLTPLLLLKSNAFIYKPIQKHDISWLFVPLGISFYSLQIVSYLFDIWKGETEPESNLLKYALFISFFPHIMQGPIPRYNDLAHQLFLQL